METTRAVEDYLKTIHALRSQSSKVTNGSVAERMGVSPPSVSAMLHRLEGAGLVRRTPDANVDLTDAGQAAALRVVRRHRLLETFLHETLGVPWDEVHDEAEILEHALSERLEDRISDFLGHPTRDPHGDPIPPKHGTHVEQWPQSLDTANQNKAFRVERVSDRRANVLRHLGDIGIRPGCLLFVEERAPFEGPLWVRIDGSRHALSPVLTLSVFGSEVDAEPLDAGA